MRKCPSCGFNNPESRERCVRCSTLLVSAAVPDGSVAAERGPDFAPGIALRRWIYFLGEKAGGRLPHGVPHRYPWTAAYLSLIPGGGQFYNRQPVKAVILILLYIGFFVAAIATLFQPWNNWLLLAFVFFLFYVMADGFITANRINGALWGWKQVLAMWFAFMFFCGVVLTSGQFFAQGGLFYLVTIRTDSLFPGLKAGDKVFVLARELAGSPPAGAFVYYDPPMYSVHKFTGLSTDIFTVNERNSFGVITATEGEIMAVARDGEITVHGVPVPPGRLPINPAGPGYDIEVPIDAGHYGILISHATEESSILSGLGGSFAGRVSTPRQVLEQGNRLEHYTKAVHVPDQEIWGTVLFRYHPPERRTWWGFDGPLWEAYPTNYPPGKQ